MKKTKQTASAQRNRLMDGARNYALADRSDPFAYARIMTHVGNGIASIGAKDDDDRIYSAEPYRETRHLPDGTAFSVTCYKTMRRP